MTRIRTIKPEFWTDEKVVELSAFARLLFIGIWNFCDDEGRMVYSPKRLKMQIFPADSVDIAALFAELVTVGLVQVYAVDGTQYLMVRGFARHQRIDKRAASRLPQPPVSASCGPESPRRPPNPVESHRIPPGPGDLPRIPPTEGKGMEGKGTEGKVSEANASGAAAPDSPAPIAAPMTSPPAPESIEPSPTPPAYGKDALWAAAKSLLEQSGMPARQCGPFVGKLARDYGSELVMEAVGAAVLERPADPVGYLTATCQRLAGQRSSVVPWYATEQGVLAKGREVSLDPHPGESMQAFKARIETALARGRDPPAVREQRSLLLKASLKRCEA